jgi:hypothetical protein
MPAQQTQAWSPQHEDALKALIHLGLGKQYGRSLLEAMPQQNSLDDLVNMAVQAHGKAYSRTKTLPVKGGPKNAVPLKDPAKKAGPAPAPLGAAPPTQRPSGPVPLPKVTAAERLAGPGAPPPAQPGGPVPSPAVSAAQRLQVPRESWSSILGRSAPPPAPLSPAAAQTQPQGQPGPTAGALGPSEKPRIRVRTVGQRIPAAPLGAPAPAAGPTTPSGPPMISTREDYDKLPPGTLFKWSDGRLYRAHVKQEKAG